MSCGVQITLLAATATCDNTGTSSHAGAHSGTLSTTIVIFGFSWTTSSRIWWKSGAVPVKQKSANIGESDFV